ncbi:beta-ketoacyl-[acyl-carrier-protein] synthase family protein [Cephaloticoccus primus]|uniref:beta-ketoacyl-[acyl-carrier-protein] synthase family protein n=1 Tax=Cephaloticoccus primus TaxID=1548207 RepID=UPI0009EE114C|nr:beta-ketoacyl-[acyl-carrier-protein] synthase family protein [Cephaloticoccus primus]
MRTWLSTPGVVCALGAGINTVAQHAFAADTSGMQPEMGWVSDHALTLGRFSGALPPIPEYLPAHYRSRNNQLLLAAAQQIEPQLRVAIAQYGALRIAVVLGTSTSGVNENTPAFETLATQGEWPLDYDYRRQELSSPASFLASWLGLSGIAYTISTACTSSARALLSAQHLLSMNLCDAVICGGADTLCRLTINGFAAIEAIDPVLCRPFSVTRRGINIGEASVIFLMTREKHDPESISLLGGGASSDAYHMSSPHPDGTGAIEAMQAALQTAKVSANDIGWVNLHGTGTAHNDAMESLAMQRIFPRGVPCTSTKPLTGHTLGTASALEAALAWATLLPTRNPEGRLIPHLWDNQVDPTLPVLSLTHAKHTYPRGKPRVAMSNSFAFGGSNVSLIFSNET